MTGLGLARVILDGLAALLGVLVWPLLLGFIVWRLERPLGALLAALTGRLRGGSLPAPSQPPDGA